MPLKGHAKKNFWEWRELPPYDHELSPETSEKAICGQRFDVSSRKACVEEVMKHVIDEWKNASKTDWPNTLARNPPSRD